MSEFGFGPAMRDEETVFGAQRPGYSGKFVQRQLVDDWLKFMFRQKISRVVCLLSQEELEYYPLLSEGLLGVYTGQFSKENVLWTPTKDQQLLDAKTIEDICYFLRDTKLQGARAVVHCSAGVGRTGQALAAWLIYYWDTSERKAIKILDELNRSPREAVFYGNATEAGLLNLLAAARTLEK